MVAFFIGFATGTLSTIAASVAIVWWMVASDDNTPIKGTSYDDPEYSDEK